MTDGADDWVNLKDTDSYIYTYIQLASVGRERVNPYIIVMVIQRFNLLIPPSMFAHLSKYTKKLTNMVSYSHSILKPSSIVCIYKLSPNCIHIFKLFSLSL